MKKCLARPWKVLWSQRGSRMLMVAGRDGGIFCGGGGQLCGMCVCVPACLLDAWGGHGGDIGNPFAMELSGDIGAHPADGAACGWVTPPLYPPTLHCQWGAPQSSLHQPPVWTPPPLQGTPDTGGGTRRPGPSAGASRGEGGEGGRGRARESRRSPPITAPKHTARPHFHARPSPREAGLRSPRPGPSIPPPIPPPTRDNASPLPPITARARVAPRTHGFPGSARRARAAASAPLPPGALTSGIVTGGRGGERPRGGGGSAAGATRDRAGCGGDEGGGGQGGTCQAARGCPRVSRVYPPAHAGLDACATRACARDVALTRVAPVFTRGAA